jgi:phospholipase C
MLDRDQISRRRMLQRSLAVMTAAAGGGALAACSDQLAKKNAADASKAVQTTLRKQGLILPPGTLPYPDRPEGVDTMPQIEHIVIYMQENHSYDGYFGMLGRGDGFSLGPDGKPTNSNLDESGKKIVAYHEPDTCNVITGDHSWNGSHRQWNHGAMDGFAKSSGAKVMGYYDESNLPFYYGLAKTFPLCDRWFSSVMGPTYPNRRYMLAGTSAGVTATDTTMLLANPTAPNGTIFDRLTAHGISWVNYVIDLGDSFLFPGKDPKAYLQSISKNIKPFDAFRADCAAGTLPSVCYLGPGVKDQYDEGSRDVHNGEAYSASIIKSVMASPLWSKTAILFTYDEHGGGYDHVPPPKAVAPDDIAPILQPGDEPGGFDQLGMRVPGFVISPYAKRNYISHEVRDHAALLRFVETKWNLGALTYRDANADNLLDCFDFTKASFPDPPKLPAPGLPEGGSPCQPQPRPPIPAGY